MTFWELASKDFLAVCALLYFLWAVFERFLTYLESRKGDADDVPDYTGRLRRIEARLQKLERERKHDKPFSWTGEKTETTTTTTTTATTATTPNPTLATKEKPHE